MREALPKNWAWRASLSYHGCQIDAKIKFPMKLDIWQLWVDSGLHTLTFTKRQSLLVLDQFDHSWYPTVAAICPFSKSASANRAELPRCPERTATLPGSDVLGVHNPTSTHSLCASPPLRYCWRRPVCWELLLHTISSLHPMAGNASTRCSTRTIR